MDVRPNEIFDLPHNNSGGRFLGDEDVNDKMSDGRNLPARYVCHTCGVCVATADGHAKDEAEAHIFKNLYGNIAIDKANKAIACPFCQSTIGSRGNNAFALRKGLVLKRQDKLEILVCSLKEPEIASVAPALQEAFPYSNVTSRVLQKAELRGFELRPGKPGPDLVVVVHKNEGRALITDRNGFYHDVLGSAWQLTRGNVLLVLTRTEPKGGVAELFDGQLLKSLSTQGDQPTIGAISSCGRVLTWESQPSQPQLKQMQLLSEKAYFREAPVMVQGIPVAWTRKPEAGNAGASWCNVL